MQSASLVWTYERYFLKPISLIPFEWHGSCNLPHWSEPIQTQRRP